MGRKGLEDKNQVIEKALLELNHIVEKKALVEIGMLDK